MLPFYLEVWRIADGKNNQGNEAGQTGIGNNDVVKEEMHILRMTVFL
jgi:hypothetical protein